MSHKLQQLVSGMNLSCLTKFDLQNNITYRYNTQHPQDSMPCPKYLRQQISIDAVTFSSE